MFTYILSNKYSSNDFGSYIYIYFFFKKSTDKIIRIEGEFYDISITRLWKIKKRC